MGHRATIYNVSVHKRNHPKELLPLGNIDGSGKYLGDFLVDAFNPQTFSAVNEDDTREVRCSTRKLAGESKADLQVILNPGERGVRANIIEPDGQVGFEQTAKHTQLLTCGSLFRLPRKPVVGWWACHINSNRSVKSLVHTRLLALFKETFGDDLMLKITPCVNAAAFKDALDNDRLLSASLSKYEHGPDIAEGGQWVKSDTGLKLRLYIRPQRGKRLLPTLVKKALGGDKAAFGQIVEFGGVSFDSAKFEVELENGIHRSFNIEAPDSGHAFSEDIDPEISADGELKDESLFSELGRVITELG
jgi:hypothetical protein